MSNYQIIGLLFALVGLISGGILAWEGNRKQTLHLERLPLTQWMILISRILLGVLFFYSGFVKANDYIGFGYKLEEYFYTFAEQMPWMAGFWEFWEPLSAPLAWFISVFEMALAVAILVGWRMNLTAWLSLLMMVFFTILTAYSAITGSVQDCGCFGDALKITPWESFSKDIILTIVLIPLFLVRKTVKPWPDGRIAGMITAAAFVGSGLFSWWCHEHLPMVDYRAYKVGVDVQVCTEVVPPGEDFPKCKDFYPAFMGEEQPAIYAGRKMWILAYDLPHADEDALAAIPELAERYRAQGIEPILLTSTTPKDTEEILRTHGIDLPVGFGDGTALKTIIRSNPGYVLLQDGVIEGKWHHNDAPTLEDLP